MNFLVNGGHKDAGEKFQTECGTDSGVELLSISERTAIRQAIQSGKVQTAIERANNQDLHILDKNPELLFRLLQQKLIEFIRTNDVAGALRVAEKELVPMCEENLQFLASLESAMTLLAISDMNKSPTAHLLSANYRQKTVNELNTAILRNQGKNEAREKLPGMFKLLNWAEENLKEYTNFPEMT